MTKAEILTSARNLIQVYSTDTGATLTDVVLGELADRAMEEVVLSCLPFMPEQLLSTEDITLVAGTANYTLTNTTWLQVYKVELNLTGHTPHEIQKINPLDKTYVHYVGETASEPSYFYTQGDTFYFVPTPSAAQTGYARVYLVNGEATTIATAGPTYLPRMAHALIAYMTAWMAAVAYSANATPFKELYAMRMENIRRAWMHRFRQEPRFIAGSSAERSLLDTRERAFYDLDWK